MKKLRDYQQKAIDEIRLNFARGYKRIVVASPTGSGKTFVFSTIAKKVAEKGGRVLIITHRKELASQSSGTMVELGLKPIILNAETKQLPEPGINVAMVETIKRRIEKPGYTDFVQAFEMIIFDELHLGNFDRVFESITLFQYVLGFSATPYRTGKMKPLSEMYDKLIDVVQISELVKDGFLSPARTFGIPIDLSKVKLTAGEFDSKQMTELYDDYVKYVGAVENYKKHTPNTKALLFAPSVKNSERMAETFLSSGIDARHLDANTPKNEREQILIDFKADKFKVLCNVGILTTGYDEPSIETIIIYRATRSLPLWLQMCGRGSRINDGKENFTILDFGENAKRHNFWEAERKWSLEIQKPPKKVGMELVKECPSCGALIAVNSKTCKYCGHEFKTEIKPKTEIEILLQELTPTEIQRYDWDIFEMEQARVAKGYKLGWLLRRLKTHQDFEDYARLKGYKKGWIYYNAKNYLKNG